MAVPATVNGVPSSLTTPKRPTQGILRSSETSHKKRPSSSISGSQESIPSLKRQRVTFEQRPQVHVVRDEENEKSVALITAEIRHALTKHAEGESSLEYEDLQQCFTLDEDDEEAPSNTYLGRCLVGLASNSNLLKHKCGGLVHAVLRMKWLHRNDDFYQKYQKFLTQLVSSQSGSVYSVLKMLVENFAHLSTSSSGVRRTPALTRQILQDRVHSCIKYVVFMVPSATPKLCDILSDTFPFVTDTKRAHVEYVQNLLRLANSMHELRSNIITLILDRLVQIDVQVQIDISDLEEDISDLLLQQRAPALPSSQPQDDPDSTDATSSSDDSTIDDPEAARIKSLRLLVSKMDLIMDQLFSYLHPLLTKSTPEVGQRTFTHLLSHLQGTLLLTPSSRHIQFLLFTAAQVNSHCSDQLLETTLAVLTNPSKPAILRVSAAAYTASFTARAQALKSDSVLYVFHTLIHFISAYRKQHEQQARGPDLTRHSPYYAAVQAALYIFCFRWRDLLADAEDIEEGTTDEDHLDAANRGELEFVPGIKDALHQAFHGRLNPLKVCSPGIVQEFAHVAFELRSMYVFSIIDSNKRVRIARTVQAGARETALSGLRGQEQLEAYFPFDPYSLPLSKRWVDGSYLEYRGVPGQQAAAGATEEVEDEAEEEGASDAEELSDDDSVATPEDA